MITVTSVAASKISNNLGNRGHGIGIRLGVKPTGCSGFAYVLEYVDTLNDSDTVFTDNGIQVIIDQKSLVVLDGILIDYVRRGLNEGFEFTNAKEKDRCGCGESFRV